jgi:hypothetical protein
MMKKLLIAAALLASTTGAMAVKPQSAAPTPREMAAKPQPANPTPRAVAAKPHSATIKAPNDTATIKITNDTGTTLDFFLFTSYDSDPSASTGCMNNGETVTKTIGYQTTSPGIFITSTSIICGAASPPQPPWMGIGPFPDGGPQCFHATFLQGGGQRLTDC